LAEFSPFEKYLAKKGKIQMYNLKKTDPKYNGHNRSQKYEIKAQV